MTDDIDTANADPRATGRDRPRDRIMLGDHVVTVEIGAFQAERGTTQRIRFNVVVEIRDAPGAANDDVDGVMSYDTITEAISAELGARRFDLLETLAENVAVRILADPMAARVHIRIEKLDRGPFTLGVEIVRDAAERRVPATPIPSPVVAYLSDAALALDDLDTLLDRLAPPDAGLVICVGPAPLVGGITPAPSVRRRIDLLAIEQQAWLLAGRDARLDVVATRTEVEWSLRNARTIIWSPVRLVFDNAGQADPPPDDPVALSAWFARHYGARALYLIGARLPSQAGVPAHSISPDNWRRDLPTDRHSDSTGG